jgi:cell division protein FtsI/penicillin-binding protein 2
MSDPHFQQMLTGMEQAVQFGTAQLCKIPGIRIAAKTGTAQVKDSDRKSATFGEKLTLAWFIGFAPVDNPSIAIAICVEGTDPDDNYQGGTTAAPIARNLFWTYFAKKSKQRLTQRN